MEIIKRRNGLEVHLPNKVVNLRGHQDSDVYTVFTESVYTHPSLNDYDIKILNEEFRRRGDIVIR